MPRLNEYLTVYVPTRGRIDKQITWEQFCLSADWSPHAVRVVPNCEFPNFPKGYKVPDEYGIAEIRQSILEHGTKYQLVLDDDLRVAHRRQDDPTKFINLDTMEDHEKQRHLEKLFHTVLSLLQEGWVHGGIAVRQGANRNTHQFLYNHRVLRAHFYNAYVVRELGQDFSKFKVKQDYDFTLHLLSLGIPNIVINEYVQDHPGSNLEGGCSRYRTEEVLISGAKQLKAKYPDFVKVVEKNPKKAWGGEKRVDVNIQWKKCYKKGREYARGLQKQDISTLDDKDRAVLRLQPQLQLLPYR